MAFFQRIFSYVINEVIVDTLANNRSFQRFAIRTNKQMEELAKKSKEAQKVFNEELDKGMQEVKREADRVRQQNQHDPKNRR
mmetsp:Transcript_41106/g.78494  ORF Transcript_41106/g.78494 Transcript_41106/m.78494 type:complete len:82 (+) Transcript_41106:83-328(+)|eukprot:CAMPEP_0114225410 /NCGR_PEP_ID=MMETSP0058-20121206/650_1 /TAXON_ID=36894 /ORGANISM="Pyramimonas parkeae, CCMP726" /LENGTH=81 /DNA_ID=CAMNT_0001335999 /DNA_START=62 /DNA_END=307 /DNA_ORIENTATION=+